MKKILFLILCISTVFVSCKSEEIALFSDGNELYFAKPYMNTTEVKADTIHVSFHFMTEDECVIKLPVLLSGMPLTQDRPFVVAVDPATDADASNYRLNQEYVFKSNTIKGEIEFNVIKDSRLSGSRKKIVLKIGQNNFFKAGQTEYAKAVITITNDIARPQWWDEQIEKSLLGTYSDAKYIEFFKCTKVYDLTNLDTAHRWALAIEFKTHLAKEKKAGNMIMDGTAEMTVPVVG